MTNHLNVIRWARRALAMVILVGALQQAAAQSTAFTYSGQLTGNGVLVSGNFDMRFTLYDATNGNAVAGPVTNSPVEVANGLFTTRIDFGPGAFPGAPRWLDVAVRPVGGSNYAALTPRQEVTSSPYSIRSQSAGSADGGGGGSNGVWSVNGTTTYYNAGKVGIGTVTPGFGKLTVRSGGPIITDWYGIEHTDGTVRMSTYIDPTGGWLGTITSHPLKFYVANGQASMAIESGNIVMTPNGGSGGYGSTTFGTPNGESGMFIKGYGGSPNRADLRFNGSTLKLVAGFGPNTPSETSGIAITTGGNVGIGTTSPSQKLEVAGGARIEGGLTVTDNVVIGGNANVNGNATVSGSAVVGGNAYINGDVNVSGNAIQAQEKGGLAKAMAYVDAQGTLVRAYNPYGNTISQRVAEGQYIVDFGFQVRDRFFSVTAGGAQGDNTARFNFDAPSLNQVRVLIHNLFNDDLLNGSFMIIVY